MTKRYWRFEIEPDDKMMRRSRTELGEELVETLERAVKRRLMADVPLGVSLSGGSTRGGGWQRKHVGAERLRTGIGFTEPSFDESYSGRAAAFLGPIIDVRSWILIKHAMCCREYFAR